VAQAAISAQAPESIIKEAAKFPGWLSVLTGPTASGALQVPVEFEDRLLALRLTSGRIAIAHDPAHYAELRSRLHLMRTELVSIGYAVEPSNLAVMPEVMREVRLAAEKKSVGNGTGDVRTAAVTQFREWISQAKDLGATDVHLRIRGGGRGEVTVRVDGDLEHLPASQAGLTNNQVLTCMKAAYESLADRHSNSDGNFSEHETRSCIIDSQLGIPNLRLRFNSERGVYGPAAVLRLLTTSVSHKPMGFADMGFAPSQVALIETAQRMESGLTIQCGITGSGKTTVAKSFLETHPKNGIGAFYQIADPVEYLLRGVHQIGVQRSIATLTQGSKKDPYTTVVESILRMDPDIVDVGEVRDPISARAAAIIAKTGQMALATMHTGSVMGIMNRLTDANIGLTRSELTGGDMLGLLTYQALVAKLCPHCAIDQKEALHRLAAQDDPRNRAYLLHVLGALRDRLRLDVANLKFRNHEGCEACRQRGTKGLTIVAEMMIPDDDWLDLSAAGNDRAAWRQYQEAYSDGDLTSGDMSGKSVLEHAVYKALEGLIDPTGIERFGLLANYKPIRAQSNARLGTGPASNTGLTHPRALEVVHGH
jgi:type II secretory ATPase GspE/PulE/Tfp pilus assembly ATPase PilB-like protein